MKPEPAEGRIEKPGAYLMAAEDYHADPCPEPSLSCSIARVLIDRSPLHAWHMHPRLNTNQEPEEFSSIMAVGSAIHRMLLGRGKEVVEIDARTKTGLPSDNYQSADAKQQRDAALAEGFVPVLPHQTKRVGAVVRAARTQLTGAPAGIGVDGEGVAEVTVAVQDASGVWARIMVDWWSASDPPVLYDYKSTQASCAPHSIALQIARMDYAFQAAFYERVATTLDPSLAGRLSFRFIMQEAVEPPFGLVVAEMSEGDITVARNRVAAAFALWKQCTDRNEWPCYPPGIVKIQLPPFASNAWLERELMAQEDESGVTDWILAGRS